MIKFVTPSSSQVWLPSVASLYLHLVSLSLLLLFFSFQHRFSLPVPHWLCKKAIIHIITVPIKEWVRIQTIFTSTEENQRNIFFIYFYIWALENKTRKCISRWDRFKCADPRLECEQRNKDYFVGLRSLAVICYWALLHSSIKKLSVITPLQSTFNG